MQLRSRAFLLPLAFFLAGLAATLALYTMIDGVEERRVERETEVMAEQVRLRLESFIDDRVAILHHLSDGSFADAADVAANFARTTMTFTRRYPGIQALNFVDRTGTITIVVPEATNRAALGADLWQHPNAGVQLALRKAVGDSIIARTPIIQLLQGGTGFAVYSRMLAEDGTTLGYVNGVFRVQNLVDACLSEQVLRDRFSFQLQDADGTVAYSHLADASLLERPWYEEVGVRFVDHDLILVMSPTPAHIDASRTFADEALAATGGVLVLGLSLLLRLFLLRQDALRVSQARYRFLVENQSDLVVQLDDRGHLVYVSPSFCRAHDKPETDLLGVDFNSLVHPEDRDRALTALAGMTQPPAEAFAELRILARSGIRWQSWSFRAVAGEDGRVSSVTGSGRDITRRRELEEKLTLSRKMQAVGQLAGGIAHDFNNLLQTMLGNLQFVVQDTRPTGQTADDLKEIENGIDRAIALTRQLLAFSRRQDAQARTHDLGPLVERIVQEFAGRLPASLRLDLQPAAGPLPVRCEPGQVEQIITNILDNAREAVTTDGAIVVRLRTRHLTSVECADIPGLHEGAFAELRIRDNGTGMPPEVRERVFEPFFTTRQVGAGTGLGLATAFGLAGQHNGTILVESEVGAGSVFTVLLPLDPAAEEADTTDRRPPRPQARGGTETILIAEDDHSVRELAVRVLKRADYEVLVAEDGREAVDIFATRPGDIDLVILDMVMPNMGGRETRDALVAIRPDVRVLFASGFDPATLAADHELGPQDEVLNKPYGIPDLLQRVRGILDRDPD